MSLFQFYLTMATMLVSVLTASACLSSYLVSRSRAMLFTCAGFLFYFADMASVLQDCLIVPATGSMAAGEVTLRLPLSAVTGCGILTSFWLMALEYLGKRGRKLAVIPGAVFLAVSLAILALVPDGDVKRFWFYTLRSLYLLWIACYAAYAYASCHNEAERARLWRYRRVVALFAVMAVVVALEDARYFLWRDALTFDLFARSLTPDRNYPENILALFCCFFVCRSCFRSLSLRFERPPAQAEEPQVEFIDENLLAYAQRYRLSEREREVLRMVLVGKDNQNIATELQVALSTVKVHVHHILQKTGQSNRQALLQDFWRR